MNASRNYPNHDRGGGHRYCLSSKTRIYLSTFGSLGSVAAVDSIEKQQQQQQQQEKTTSSKQPLSSNMTPKNAFKNNSSASSRTIVPSLLPHLEPPEILFSNNHLLVINKPPGWKSQPGGNSNNNFNSNDNFNNIGDNDFEYDPKCLLTHLKKTTKYGGGSKCDFLIPTHRLDQPCTGILVFAKNGKAASRVQSAWGKGLVQKEYWVVVDDHDDYFLSNDGDDNDTFIGLKKLRSRSKLISSKGGDKTAIVNGDDRGGNSRNNKDVYQLSAVIQTKKKNNSAPRGSKGSRGGVGGKGRNRKRGTHNKSSAATGSVTVTPLNPNNLPPSPPSSASSPNSSSSSVGRVCHIKWRHLAVLPPHKSKNTNSMGQRQPRRRRHLLSVTTDTGAKHQVRALLALAGGTPIVGDLRYGDTSQANNRNLHNGPRGGNGDRTITAPLADGSVALHARSVFLPTVKLGGMEFLTEEPFVAPIPWKWRDFFGITEEDFSSFSSALANDC